MSLEEFDPTEDQYTDETYVDGDVFALKVTDDNIAEVAQWFGGASLVRTDEPERYINGRKVIEFATTGGILTADVGYWIVNDRGLRYTLSDLDFKDRFGVPEQG